VVNTGTQLLDESVAQVIGALQARNIIPAD